MFRFSKNRRAFFRVISGSLLWMSGAFSCPQSVFSAEFREMPLVGIDKEGRSKAIYIPGERYLDKMSSTLLSVNQAVIPELNQRSCEEEDRSHYELTTVAVALGIEFQVGLGALFSITAGRKMELVYANQFDPVISE